MKTGFREKNGKLEYRFSYQGKHYSVSATTERECKARAAERIQEASRGLKRDAKKITWAEYTDMWLKHKETTLKESTIYSYRKKLKMVSALDPMRLCEIKRGDILDLQRDLAKRLSTSTVNWQLTTIRHIFDEAIADGYIDKNPAFRIKPLKRTEPRAVDTIHRAFTPDEQTRFFAYARQTNAWYLELYEFMLVTGVRVGEAGALTWSDVNNCIHICKTISQVGKSSYTVQSTKTDAGIRDLPLTESARDILSRQRIKVGQYKGLKYLAPEHRIFYGFTDDSCINSSKVDSAIEIICRGAGIDKRTSHAFRDTYATRCIQQGMQPNTLKKLMGHTKIAITMDLYAQVQPEDMQAAMDRINIL